MKCVLFLNTLLCIAMSSFSQWIGSDQTLQSGTYSIGIGANVTIADSATVHFTSLQLSSGSLIIRPGATVIVEQVVGNLNGKVILRNLSSFFANANIATTSGFLVGPLSNVVISGDLDFSNGVTIDSGNMVITGTTTLRKSNSLILYGCSSFTSQVINNLAGANPVLGTGYISTNSYLFNGSGADHVSNSFTSSNSISIRYSGTNLSGLSNNGHDLITPVNVVSPIATAGCSVITPVVFDGFTVTHASNGINVSWTTKMEQNNKYFVLEGSNDGKSFDSLIMVKSYWINGNSNSEHTYNYVYASMIVKEGSMMLFCILIMSISILFFIFKNTNAKVILIVLFSISTTFIGCTKSNNTNQLLITNSYSVFRVKQIDVDGHVNYNQTIARITQ